MKKRRLFEIDLEWWLYDFEHMKDHNWDYTLHWVARCDWRKIGYEITDQIDFRGLEEQAKAFYNPYETWNPQGPR